MPSLTVQRNLKPPCPHCRGTGFALGGQVGDEDDDSLDGGEAALSYEDERAELDRGMRLVDAYSGRGSKAEAGFADGGVVDDATLARLARREDKGAESNAARGSFAAHLARRRGVRAYMRGGKVC